MSADPPGKPAAAPEEPPVTDAAEAVAAPEPAMGVEEPPRVRAFGRTYWMLNSIEMFERLAYFGVRAVVPLYIMQAGEPGGLHLTAVHKGFIYAWWAVFQSFLPIVTGGIADRYGYKRVLTFAISMNVIGYIIMATFHSYLGFFAGVLVLATGTAFFKPSLQGSIAQNLTKANSSLGWGVFYWVVNVGAFMAPFISTAILGKPHSQEGWRNLFYACAAFTACNLLLLLTFKDVPSGASKTETPWQVLKRTIINIFEPRLIIWLLIMSCFWLMMYQLWDLHPNFITDWVDSSRVAAHAPEIWQEYGDRGLVQVPQQILLNLNAGLIILLMVPLSWAARKMRTLSAMLVGMTVATGGILVAGLTGNGWILLLGIVFFSLGEMWTGPKKNEYLALIAPPGKKALYLGYVNIPVGIGLFVGSYLAGWLYNGWGEKATLALKELGARPELVARAAQSADWSDSLDKVAELADIERSGTFTVVCGRLNQDADAAGATLRGIFRHDRGQIVNLGRQYLAQTERHGNEADQLNAMEVLGLVREDVNQSAPADQRKEDAEIIEMLWAEFGNSSATLNNLALEYLAQGTSVISDTVAGMTFKDPTEELPKRVGIGRTKSFAALSAARGADDAQVAEALAALAMPRVGPHDRAFVYLVSKPHHRFVAVARKDWTKDVVLLQALVSPDPGARDVVLAEIDREAWYEELWGAITGVFGSGQDEGEVAPDGVNYHKLANKQDLIQKALAAKDWLRSPQQAAQLLGLNRFEARALVAAEVNNSPQTTTLLLWERYDPQYKVWIPFAAIGVLAAIALGIFGQMAKRWADMNA